MQLFLFLLIFKTFYNKKYQIIYKRLIKIIFRHDSSYLNKITFEKWKCNMTIVSISLNEKLLQEIDHIKDEMGFSGRSEVIRASARMLIADNKEKDELNGEINSVLILIHHKKVEDKVTEIKHDFEDVISTQIHSHLREEKCLEIFILDGNAHRMNQFYKMFETSPKMEYVKLIVV